MNLVVTVVAYAVRQEGRLGGRIDSEWSALGRMEKVEGGCVKESCRA